MSYPEDPFGAFCRENHVALKGSAAGPLRGLTFAAKDVFDIAGVKTGFGNPDWLRTHAAPAETAECIQRLLDAGADMSGKTLTDELTYSLTGENAHYGTPRNPRAADRIPGGSSSGSAVAAAAGLVDFAMGTDCGGSVRLPASYCGIFGFRPTRGRVSTAGVIPFAPSFDVVGWFASDIGVLGKVGSVVLDKARDGVRPRSILFALDAFGAVTPEVAEALSGPVSILCELVGNSQDITISPTSLDEWRKVFQTIQASEIWGNHGDWIASTNPRFGPGIKERFAAAARISANDVVRCRRERSSIVAHIDSLLDDGAVLCLPTSPRVAPLRDSPLAEIEVAYRNQAMSLLCIAGLAGLPQVSLPAALMQGLPLGLSLVARRGADEMLLELAKILSAELNIARAAEAGSSPARE